VVAHNGGSVLFYIHEKDRATTDRLAEWLMTQPWCGSMLASEAVEGIAGTLPLRLAQGDGARSPDLAISLAWDSTPNQAGYPGHAYCTGLAPGLGLHGSMSRHEMRNTLVARGPSFKRGVAVSTPTGNVDLTPTILHILGISPAVPMDGRPLLEALEGGPDPASVQWATEVHRAERPVGGGVYRQEVTVSHVDATTYIDQGTARLDIT
jgi:hypothetical protein